MNFNHNFKDKSVLIIGGGGFIGSHLADRLCDYVKSLTILDGFIDNTGANLKNTEALKDRGVRLVQERLEESEKWKILLNEVDIIFNFASFNSHKESIHNPELDYYRNALPHLKFITTCQSLHKRLTIIFASSRSVYGSVNNNPVSESQHTLPKDFYSLHTLLSEHYYRLFAGNHLSVCCVRFSNVYGPRQRLRGSEIGLLGELFRSALTARPMEVYGNGETLKDILYIDDLVNAFISLPFQLEEPFLLINVGGCGVMIKDFASTITKFMASATIKFIPYPSEISKIQVGDVLLDASLIQKRTGWSAITPLDDGIEKTLVFFTQKSRFYL